MKNKWKVTRTEYVTTYDIGFLDLDKGDDIVISCEENIYEKHKSFTVIHKLMGPPGSDQKGYGCFKLRGNHFNEIDRIYPDADKIMEYHDECLLEERRKIIKEREGQQYRYTYPKKRLFGLNGKKYSVYAKNEEEACAKAKTISENSDLSLVSVEELQS
jgi:hypothetical protein